VRRVADRAQHAEWQAVPICNARGDVALHIDGGGAGRGKERGLGGDGRDSEIDADEGGR